MITPKKAFTVAANREVRKLKRSAARVRAPVTTSQKPAKPKLADLSTSAASGMRTIRLRYVKVKPSANPKPGMALGRFNARPRAPAMCVYPLLLVGGFRLVDLVEDATVVEVLRLRLSPSAEQRIVDRDELDVREAREILRIGRLRVCRAIVVMGDQLLCFRRVEEVQIGLRHFARAFGVDHLVDNGDRRLGLDGERRRDDLEFVGAELVEREEGLVLPSEQNVADAALGKGRRRSAGAGVEHGHMRIEVLDELLVLFLVVAKLLVGIGPGREIVPAGAAGGL